MAPLPFPRLFSMPAFEGLRVLRLHIAQRPGLPLWEIVGLIRRVEPEALSLDLEAAQQLHEMIGLNTFGDGIPFYRGCISSVLLASQPVWLKMMTQGRRRFLQKLNRDELSLFRQAGLTEPIPALDVVEWWDRVTGTVRLTLDQDKLERARTAEKLSLDSEAARLKAIGISTAPVWMGIEDNLAGYDVLSYDPANPNPTNKLIEVKSTIASPLRFILTRNEWETSRKAGSSYCFHIWDLQQEPPVLYERSVMQVAGHIPTDSGKGKWKAVEIPVGI